MKLTNTFRSVTLIILMFSTFVSCNKEESKNTVNNVSDTVKEGTWRISYFYHSGKTETEKYVGYNFVFGGNGILTASKETNTYNGQWLVNESTSDDDLFSTIFKISMSPTDIFSDLNEDWKVIENADSTLKLKDDSHGDTAIDYLTFQKIEQ